MAAKGLTSNPFGNRIKTDTSQTPRTTTPAPAAAKPPRVEQSEGKSSAKKAARKSEDAPAASKAEPAANGAKESDDTAPRPAREARKSNVVDALRDNASLERLRFSDVASNPENPERRAVDDVDELAGSITEVGLLQPIVVVEASSFLKHKPAYREELAGKRWIVVAGNRRFVAAQRAGQDSVLAYVLPGDVSPDMVMFHENAHRLALSPIEEAETFQRIMREQKLSQRALAAKARVPQSQVSRRLALLTLPSELRAALDAGDLTLADGSDVAAENSEVRDRVAVLYTKEPQRPVRELINEAVRDLGDTAESVEDDEPAADEQSTETTEQKADVEQRPLDDASKARTKALGSIVKRPLSPAMMNADIIDMVLAGRGLDNTVATIAVPLTAKAGLSKVKDANDRRAWLRSMAELTRKDSTHAAWIIALSTLEASARKGIKKWDDDTYDYVAFLADNGYKPTADEQQALEEYYS